ncbi:VOC family protein [Microtetraspora sp. NBRC 16547]|uniref:VOC family protein n=1 Tax=Microtetraspora sp. NBRC 16547 TaxID=3030993 RepID=UPI0024A0E47A|nr:VOC family protein [Microtetraspora sp. NBRC 16547]GLX02653.1 hypothetical protein Misp02_67390 [Microtetraspora sp. NBRC 16547]
MTVNGQSANPGYTVATEGTATPTLKWPTFDHLAIAVRRWEDVYQRFGGELGGRWGIANPAGDFAPFQLGFGAGLRLEFISPQAPDGFMQRFIERHGPAPHHITFKVPSLEETLRDLVRLGFETFGGRPDYDAWRESFIHPRNSALGTLVQVVEADVELINREAPRHEPPAGFPTTTREAAEIAMIGVTSMDLARAQDLLGRALLGDVLEEGGGWFFVTWGRGRSIIVRDPSAAPGFPALWTGPRVPGVSFVLFGPPDLSVGSLREHTQSLRKLPDHETTGIDVWQLA